LSRHPLRGEFERVIAGRLPENWQEGLAAWRAELADARATPRCSGAAASARALQTLLPALPELIGGATARGESFSGAWSGGMARVGPNSLGGRYIEYGARDHAMVAAMNGMALHGGLIPTASGLLAQADYMRPALRLAAVMRQRMILVLTQEPADAGDDGPAQQADAQLASLRAIGGLWVFRPADALEAAECWELALRRADGPSVLVLAGEASQTCAGGGAQDNRCARGGYVLAEAAGARALTLLASGGEVAAALAARQRLAAQGIACAVVSLPCWALFAAQAREYRAGVLGTAPRLAFEAGCGFGWERWLGEDGAFLARGSDLPSAGAGYAVQAAARILHESDTINRESRA
jgi:transketolase